MAVNTTPIFIGKIFGQNTTILPADTTTPKDVVTVDATNDRRIDCINVSTNDTAAELLTVYYHDGTTASFVGNVPLAITAGQTALGATVPLNLLTHANMAGITQVDSAGNRFINLAAGHKIQIGVTVTITAAKTTSITVRGGRYSDV